MKRFISLFLVMGIIMTAFAGTQVGSNKDVTVKLELTENKATLWFSTSDDVSQSSVSEYSLSTQITALPSNQDVTSWTAAGNELRLHWNIVSDENVKVCLKANSALKNTDSTPAQISWTVGWTGSSSIPGSNTSSISMPEMTSTYVDGIVFLKSGAVYGNSGFQLLTINTGNTFDKPTGSPYTATLTAYVETI